LEEIIAKLFIIVTIADVHTVSDRFSDWYRRVPC